jgi:arylsulfatase A-like enzyme
VKRPNVLFIVIDTLRFDHVGCYGAARETTPAIDALAADAVRFERAYATAPWTIPSVGSMLTGLYPSRHTATSFPRQLPDDVQTLAEILKREGYATAGVVSHWAIGTRFNFQQGYDVYLESEARGHDHVSTPGVTRQALEQLEALAAGDRPFFLFVHYFDPHYNYLRHPEYGFAPPSAGRLKGGEPIGKLTRMTADMSPEEAQFLRDLYDEEIRFTDAGIGRLLDKLDVLGHRGDTLIVLTADHGEEFLDHGQLGHTKTLYEELVRIPLIVRERSDSRPGVTVEQPVSLVSLPPTILDVLGVDPSPFSFQAASIEPLRAGSRSGEPDVVFFEVDFVPVDKQGPRKEVHKKGIVGERYKLIRDDTTLRAELYDLGVDGGEDTDLAGRQPELASELLAALDRAIALAGARGRDARERILDEEEIRRLRGLGYLGD